MRVNGGTTKLKEKVLSGTLKEMFMLGISKQTKPTDMVFTHTLTDLDTKDNGSMMFKKDKEKKHGLTVPNMLVSIRMDRNTGMEFTNGLMEVSLKVTGRKIK